MVTTKTVALSELTQANDPEPELLVRLRLCPGNFTGSTLFSCSQCTPLNSSGHAFQVCYPFQKVCIYMYMCIYTSYACILCTVLCEKLHVHVCIYTHIVYENDVDLI